MLELKGVMFNRSFIASGTPGFDGKGYWFHRFLGVNYNGANPVIKTSPVGYRAGNMLLDGDNSYRPREKKPKCIKVNFFTKSIVNAVGLSSPGLRPLLAMGVWQNFQKPFWLSYMPVRETHEERREETEEFVITIKRAQPSFKAPFGVKLNVSCPNTKHDMQEVIKETNEHLIILSELNVPLGVKFNILTPTKIAKEISEYCDCLFIPNSIPWGALENKIPWNKLFLYSFLFGKSPLHKYGGGGYSGTKQFPLTIEWVKEARAEGIGKPIIVGSLYKPKHIPAIIAADGSGISIGATATFFYPGNVQKIIKKANHTSWR